MVSLFEEVAVSLVLSDWKDKCDRQNLYRLEWGRNAHVGYGRKKWGLVDLVVNLRNLRTLVACKTIHYEMKSCVLDLCSGNGVNLYADYNYIVYPKDCRHYVTSGKSLSFEYLDKWTKKRKLEYVGIICIDEDLKLQVEREARHKNAKRVALG